MLRTHESTLTGVVFDLILYQKSYLLTSKNMLFFKVVPLLSSEWQIPLKNKTKIYFDWLLILNSTNLLRKDKRLPVLNEEERKVNEVEDQEKYKERNFEK